MAVSPKTASAIEAERQLVFTRTFDAPRAVVFEAWTDPRHLEHWYGPDGFHTTVHQLDLKPGGVWRLTMHGPDGRDYHNRLVFVEVQRPARLVYRHEPEQGGEPVHSEVTVTFTEHAGKTDLELRMTFPTAEEREMVVRKYHADEGGKQTLAKLAQHLAEKRFGMVLSRVFDAPRDLVYQAWTDPEHLKNWWGPHHFSAPRCEVDARPGGRIHIDMRGPDGTVYPMEGRFEQVEAPERLVYMSWVNDAAGARIFDVRNVVALDEVRGKTRVTIMCEATVHQEIARQFLKGMETGWKQSLERLGSHVGDGLRVEMAGDREVVLTRTFHAPRRLVWDAYTKPEQLKRWFGPHGWTLVTCDVDFHPGGKWRFVMHGPKDGKLGMYGEYREIQAPEQIVQTEAFDDFPGEALDSIVFTEASGHTTITTRVLCSSREVRDGMLHSGMSDGAGETFERLAWLLSEMAGE